MIHPTYRTADVDGFEVFYREAGDRAKPTLLLLHGFPTSSHMFRDLIPLLADRFHLVAPDLPGFGLSALPARNQFAYTFDNLAQVIGRFTEVIGLDQFAIYIFDYGAPTGLRMAMAHPERITAIISQNGNAYKEGLSDGWNPIERYWRDPSDANRQALRELLAPGSIRWQYEHGVPEITAISPDGIALDAWYMLRPQADEVQLDLTTLPSIRPSQPISVTTNRSCWRSGARTTRFSCRPVQKPTNEICRTPRSAFSTLDISRWRRTLRKLLRLLVIFSSVRHACARVISPSSTMGTLRDAHPEVQPNRGIVLAP